jgi:hypothetical protein
MGTPNNPAGGGTFRPGGTGRRTAMHVMGLASEESLDALLDLSGDDPSS